MDFANSSVCFSLIHLQLFPPEHFLPLNLIALKPELDLKLLQYLVSTAWHEFIYFFCVYSREVETTNSHRISRFQAFLVLLPGQ